MAIVKRHDQERQPPLHSFNRRAAPALITCLVLVTTLLAGTPARAAPAILVDANTGEVVFAHRAFDRWYPASITKLMTAYLAFSAIRAGSLQPDSAVQVSKYALSKPPSKMGFPVGTRITLSSALKMLIIKSANDIAVAIGETVSGSEPAFVQQMNATARQLGMTSTRFVNPHGLHDSGQYTTARDMAVLARAILREFPQYQPLFKIPAIKVGRKVLRTHNKLIGRYPGATGMKTGYVCSAGYNLVASAKRGGRHYIAVVLGAPNGTHRALVAAHMLENGFDRTRGFFTGRGTTIDSYRGSGRAPVDMRPHLCKPRSQRVPIPRDVAYYGFDVPVIKQDDNKTTASTIVDPLARAGAAIIQPGSRRSNSRAERIAALLSQPMRGTPVSANGVLPKDELATMSLPRTIPLPERRPASTAMTAMAPQPVQSSLPAAVAPAQPTQAAASTITIGTVPMPRRRPQR